MGKKADKITKEYNELASQYGELMDALVSSLSLMTRAARTKWEKAMPTDLLEEVQATEDARRAEPEPSHGDKGE